MAGPRAAGRVSRARAFALAALVLVVVAGLDQGTKALAVASLERGEEVNVFFGLDLTNTRNTGVAFGAFADGGALVSVLIALALAGLLGYFAVFADRPLLWLPTGMLLGGALGNLADRAREGAVIDFIDPILWPVFNVADMAIVIGIVGFVYVAESGDRSQVAGGRD